MFAGGLVTNTNQSAYVGSYALQKCIDSKSMQFTYNPAGLMKLDNGFHFSLNNQTIFQNKDR